MGKSCDSHMSLTQGMESTTHVIEVAGLDGPGVPSVGVTGVEGGCVRELERGGVRMVCGVVVSGDSGSISPL